jgi:4-hydroxy-tetrahydrodipicolinate reductase
MQGVVARQDVRFGGEGEELMLTHVTQSRDSYRAGIRAALQAIDELDGLVIGLERVLGLAK